MDWWVLDLYNNGRVVELISWIFWVPLSITLHELAHGWAALWQGDDTPRRLHRLTANPIVHMGPYSLLAFAVIGIAWGVMPVDPSRFRSGRRGRVWVAGAGPAMNIALALTCLLLLVMWLWLGPQSTELYRNVAIFLWTGGWLNILLALFNLLPVPPLDGSDILAGLSFRMWRLFQHPQAQLFGLFFVLAVLLLGCGSIVFDFIRGLVILIVDLAGIPLGNPSLDKLIYG
jgi:Zn-dependent protease